LTKFLENLAVPKRAFGPPVKEKAAADLSTDGRFILIRRIPRIYGVLVGLGVLLAFEFEFEFDVVEFVVVAGVMAGVDAGVGVRVAFELFAVLFAV